MIVCAARWKSVWTSYSPSIRSINQRRDIAAHERRSPVQAGSKKLAGRRPVTDQADDQRSVVDQPSHQRRAEQDLSRPSRTPVGPAMSSSQLLVQRPWACVYVVAFGFAQYSLNRRTGDLQQPRSRPAAAAAHAQRVRHHQYAQLPLSFL